MYIKNELIRLFSYSYAIACVYISKTLSIFFWKQGNSVPNRGAEKNPTTFRLGETREVYWVTHRQSQEKDKDNEKMEV